MRILLWFEKWCYLPRFNSDTCHRVVDIDVFDGNVGDASFSVVPPKASDAYPVARTTVNVVYFNIVASSLDRDTVITCELLQGSTNEMHMLACDTGLSSSV